MTDRVRIALAGDTMLGRAVGEMLRARPASTLFAPEVVVAAGEADLFILNLECCISERGDRWPDPSKPFFFRAPPRAVEALTLLGVDCVTLANNHALDYGPVALGDTLDLLSDAGVATVGAGMNLDAARRTVRLSHHGFEVEVIAFADHPVDFAAAPDRPGVAYIGLESNLPDWITDSVHDTGADAVVVTPHWGPNMTRNPVPQVRRAAPALVEKGASLVAGHSAHVFHGVEGRVLFDLGDFIDDYAVNPRLRNDLGLLFLVDLTADGPLRLEAVPLALDYCHTRLAEGDEVSWIRDRFIQACAELGTEVDMAGNRLVIEWP